MRIACVPSRNLVVVALSVVLTAALGGCASPRAEQGRFVVEAGAYEAAFDASRQTLVDMGYTLDRVDARAGVLTTQSRPASLMHPDRVSVRVEFWPRSQFGRLPSDRSRSQIDTGPSPDRPGGVLLQDPALEEQVGSREVVVPISREPDIEDRIAGRIEARMPRR